MKIYIETLRENETKLIYRRFFNRNYKLQELIGWCVSVPKIKQTNLVTKRLSLAMLSCTIKENKELLNDIH